MKSKKKKHTIPFFRRQYTVSAEQPQKLFKQLKDQHVNATDIQETKAEIRLCVSILNCRALVRLCKENGYAIKRVEDGDGVAAVRRIKHRPALLISLFLVLLAIIYLKDIVLRFDIINEDEKIRSDIMNVLTEEGVTVGSYIPEIRLVEVERALKQRIDGISWAGITRKGNTLIIDVVENIPAVKGSFSRFPTNLVAKENATVEKIMLLDGQVKTVIGSGVCKGDIIISGTVENKKSTWKDGKENVETNIRYTRSMGTVEGTFERTVTFEQPLDDVVKKETGNVYTQSYFQLFSADIPLFFKQKIGNYYTDEKLSRAHIGDVTLPFGIKKLTFKEYDYKPVRYTQQKAAELAKRKCERYERNFLSEYKIKNKDVKTVCGEKSVKIEVTYKLYGNICEESAFFIAK